MSSPTITRTKHSAFNCTTFELWVTSAFVLIKRHDTAVRTNRLCSIIDAVRQVGARIVCVSEIESLLWPFGKLCHCDKHHANNSTILVNF